MGLLKVYLFYVPTVAIRHNFIRVKSSQEERLLQLPLAELSLQGFVPDLTFLFQSLNGYITAIWKKIVEKVIIHAEQKMRESGAQLHTLVAKDDPESMYVNENGV